MNRAERLRKVVPGAPADLIELSDERDQCLKRIRQAWREGWQAGAASQAGERERGFAEGIAAYKAAQHDAVRLTQLDVARWGPGGREHFADPRPGDYQGGAVQPW